MFFYVVSRTYAEIFSLLRICSGLLANSPGLIPQLKTLQIFNLGMGSTAKTLEGFAYAITSFLKLFDEFRIRVRFTRIRALTFILCQLVYTLS